MTTGVTTSGEASRLACLLLHCTALQKEEGTLSHDYCFLSCTATKTTMRLLGVFCLVFLLLHCPILQSPTWTDSVGEQCCTGSAAQTSQLHCQQADFRSLACCRLMGFGHRVYKTFDPRAKIMKETCHKLLEHLNIQ